MADKKEEKKKVNPIVLIFYLVRRALWNTTTIESFDSFFLRFQRHECSCSASNCPCESGGMVRAQRAIQSLQQEDSQRLSVPSQLLPRPGLVCKSYFLAFLTCAGFLTRNPIR
jgi:hypothetical protein